MAKKRVVIKRDKQQNKNVSSSFSVVNKWFFLIIFGIIAISVAWIYFSSDEVLLGPAIGGGTCPSTHPNYKTSLKFAHNPDSDKWHSLCDNCPTIANDDQKDSDKDGVGDACDLCAGGSNKDKDSYCDSNDPNPSVAKDWKSASGGGTTASLCGNGKVDPNEKCDGTNLNGETCKANGFASGTIKCTSSCSLDTSACVKTSTSGSGGAGIGGTISSVLLEAEKYVSKQGTEFVNVKDTSASGYEYVRSNAPYTSNIANSNILTYSVSSTISGAAYIWVKMRKTDGTTGSFFAELNGKNGIVSVVNKDWKWIKVSGTFSVNSGSNTVKIYSRHKGTEIDSFIVTKDSLYNPNISPLPSVSSGSSKCTDNDKDGYGTGCSKGIDCNDNNININPGKTELCADKIDNDCDKLIDSADSQCKTNLCGNGVINTGESCDCGADGKCTSAELDYESCGKQGFASGTLKCSSICKYDTSACVK